MKNLDETKQMIKELLKSDLNDSQARFVQGLKKWYKKTGKLSEKQESCLKSIYDQTFITI